MDPHELGGADAPLTIEETIPRLVNVLLDKRQRPGLEYLITRAVPCPGDPCRNNHHMAARKLTRPARLATDLILQHFPIPALSFKNVNYVNRSEESCFKVNFSM